MKLSDHHLQQLLISKYLFLHGKDALRPAINTSAGLATLLLYDAIEILIWTIAKDVDAQPKENISLPALWQAVQKGRNNTDSLALPMQNAVEDIAKARRNFKHNGQLPMHSDVERFVSYAHEFLSRATRIFYDEDFDKFSLINLIIDEKIRNKLIEADQLIDSEKYTEGVTSCAVAEHYVSKKISGLLPSIDRNLGHVADGLDRSSQLALGAAFKYVMQNLMAHRLVIVALLLEVRVSDLSNFRLLVPHVSITHSGREQISHQRFSYSSDEAKFCLLYVTDLATRAQNIFKN